MLAILRFTYNKNCHRVVLLETFRKVNWYLTIKSDGDQSFALWVPIRFHIGQASKERTVLEEKEGWLMGLEPTTPGITIQYSNQLSYSHRVSGRGF